MESFSDAVTIQSAKKQGGQMRLSNQVSEYSIPDLLLICLIAVLVGGYIGLYLRVVLFFKAEQMGVF